MSLIVGNGSPKDLLRRDEARSARPPVGCAGGLDLLDDVLAAQRADHARLARQYADQVTRAEYEARLPERQYRAVDPDNRLVAAEVERRWKLALRAVGEARAATERFSAQPPPRHSTRRCRSNCAIWAAPCRRSGRAGG